MMDYRDPVPRDEAERQSDDALTEAEAAAREQEENR